MTGDFDPKQRLKEFSERYRGENRGYYYYSSLSSELSYLMKKWKEIEEEHIPGLSLLQTDLSYFEKEELNELYKAESKSPKLRTEKRNMVDNKLRTIQASFLSLYSNFTNKSSDGQI